MTNLDDTPLSARPLVILTAVSLAFLALCILWMGFDSRQIAGSAVWAKPLKFSISFVVLFATMALAEPYFSPAWRNGRMFAGIAGVMAAAMLLEMIYMIAQASRGQTSHFNVATPFTAIMYAVMGVGAVSLVVGVGLMGWAALRDKAARFGPGGAAGRYRLGVYPVFRADHDHRGHDEQYGRTLHRHPRARCGCDTADGVVGGGGRSAAGAFCQSARHASAAIGGVVL